MSIAFRLKQRRQEMGLTQAQLAEAACVSQQSIESIENGRTKRPRSIVDLARALKCSPDWLLNGKSIMPIGEVNSRRVPLLSYVQAGAFKDANPITTMDGSFDYIYVDDDISDESFALRIEGDSMTPDFKEGDIVVIDASIEPAPGEFVFATNGTFQGTFKKYRPMGIGTGDFELVPLNEDYPAIKSSDHHIKIVGVMVEHRIYRRKR
ncbi:helix-turn-helix domain-containing protein [Vibrio fluvialis]|nr:helix-turn-helix domain-containing protein [Vibrio fluvialis]